ncbi:MAG TPA: hypothetical protein VJH92_04840 [Candidatus Nanoarchaeia archaeon]|nr:hypothetical protein [Candidatus Nanoarchaeia archaeon]
MVVRKVAYSLISALVVSGCSLAQKPTEGDVAVSDFDGDGLSDTVFAQYWVGETDIGIRYGTGINQKIARFPAEKEVYYADTYKNGVRVWWFHNEDREHSFFNVTPIYNHGKSGDTVIFSLNRQ